MWLYYCLLSTVIWGFVAIAIKKCSNNEPKRIAILGMLIYHLSMILISLIIKPQIIANLSVIDMIKMLPGILIQSIGFYCSISAIKYGKVINTKSASNCNFFIGNFNFKREIYNFTTNNFWSISYVIYNAFKR